MTLLATARAVPARQGPVRHGPTPTPAKAKVEGRMAILAIVATSWRLGGHPVPALQEIPRGRIPASEATRTAVAAKEATTLLRRTLGGLP